MCGIPNTPFTRRALLRGATVAGGAAALAAPLASANATPNGRAASARTASDFHTQLVLLGTSGGPIWWTGTETRGICSAVMVGDRYYLVDLGAGAAHAIREAGMLGPAGGRNDLSGLHGIFFTHLHSDHVTEYPTMLIEGWIGGGLGTPDRAVDVYGPGRRGELPEVFPAGRPAPPVVNEGNPNPGTVDMTNSLYAAFATDINDRMRDGASPDIRTRVAAHDIVLPGGTGDRPNERPPRMSPFLVHEDDRVRVTATLVDHGQAFPSFGFRFDTEDGSLVLSGDTTVSDNLIELAQDCDVLAHEVIDQDWVEQSIAGLDAPQEVKDAYLNHMVGAHTTIPQVGKVATDAGAKTLVLNHFVPGHLPESRWRKASRNYDGELVVGRDLQRVGVGARR